MSTDPHIPTERRHIGPPSPPPRVRTSQRVIGDPYPEPEPSTIATTDRAIGSLA